MITTMTPGGCGCGPGSDVCDDPAGLERTRFFPRQLVGPEDLTQDQRYFREKHRRHNRLLHGWGVVCGVEVSQGADANGNPVPYVACVAPGYVLGPYGDEILVDQATSFDVRRVADDGRSGCPPPTDPWCAPVRVDRNPNQTLYLAIRYDECQVRPVQTESGCGCGSDCEYSRIVDGFTLGILDALPADYVAGQDPTRAPGQNLQEAVECTSRLREVGRPCPPCPAGPWVILADFFVQPGGGLTVDQWAHRRFVAAFGPYGFYCNPRGSGQVVTGNATQPISAEPAGSAPAPAAEEITGDPAGSAPAPAAEATSGDPAGSAPAPAAEEITGDPAKTASGPVGDAAEAAPTPPAD